MTQEILESLNKEMVENFLKCQDDLIEGYLELVKDIGDDGIENLYPHLKIAMDNIIRCAEE